ncbi:Tryptophan--tRNA ligase, mitochondrial [Lithohypha guttulata]|nr:Tryptophan--tRNA ligase, mitochondrial [Lithohypha guttulata]
MFTRSSSSIGKPVKRVVQRCCSRCTASQQQQLHTAHQAGYTPARPPLRQPARTGNKSTLRRNLNSHKEDSIHKSRQTIFSLIQPTGIPHLGNYLGALRQWKDLQDREPNPDAPGSKYRRLFGLADLHSLTSKQDPQLRRENIRQTLASLLAIGLDPKHSLIFLQSSVSAHSELMWILSNVASTGYLSRMTQWKDKAGIPTSTAVSEPEQTLENIDEKAREKLKLGLFSYPVLQAADILLYDADYVPVGEDQAQHVEFTRHLARSFNSTYNANQKPILTVPQLMLSSAKRVMSLQDPTKKMSKSDPDEASRVLITDLPEVIVHKFKRALTDSVAGPITFDPQQRPGVSNLIEILRHVTRSQRSSNEIAQDYANKNLGKLKKDVAEAVINEFAGIRERYEQLVRPGNKDIEQVIDTGYHMASLIARRTLSRVKKAVGLLEPDSLSRPMEGARVGGPVPTSGRTL